MSDVIDVSSALLGVKNRKKVLVENARTDLFGFELPTPQSTNWGVEVYEGYSPVVPAKDSYVFDPMEVHMWRIAMMRKDNVLMIGPTGCGKSTFPEQYAALTNMNCVRIGFDASISREDLIGGYIVEGQNTVFKLGILPLAMQTPGTIIVLDELDSASPENAFLLHPLLEKGRRFLFIPEINQHITMHPDNIIVATANTNGQGDESGMYAGTRVQNGALMNRFSMTFKKDYLESSLEVRMLSKRFPEVLAQADGADLIPKLVKFANACRQGFKEGDIGVTVSTRDLINFLDLLQYHGISGGIDSEENPALKQSLEYSITNRMTNEDADAVIGIFERQMAAVVK